MFLIITEPTKNTEKTVIDVREKSPLVIIETESASKLMMYIAVESFITPPLP